MSGHTFIAMVRFKDQTKTKFHVSGMPHCVETIRNTVLKELANHAAGVQSVIIRTDAIA